MQTIASLALNTDFSSFRIMHVATASSFYITSFCFGWHFITFPNYISTTHSRPKVNESPTWQSLKLWITVFVFMCFIHCQTNSVEIKMRFSFILLMLSYCFLHITSVHMQTNSEWKKLLLNAVGRFSFICLLCILQVWLNVPFMRI